LFSVYALNLLLLPVNLAGVLLSIVQLVTGRKTSFGRTPKVADRTSIPPVYVAFNVAMLGVMCASIGYAMHTGDLWRTIFPTVNACFYVYGLTTMIGLRPATADLTAGFWARLEPLRRSLGVPVSQDL
jgi:hypothetical protein